jgi:hypothetical protein
MNEKEITKLANHIEKVDVEAFAWLLDLVFTHDNEAQEAKDQIVTALRNEANRKR